MNKEIKNQSLDLLYDAILSLETKDECKRFFEDLCTRSEMSAMAQRILVAKMLQEDLVYTEIVKLTGASTATISRVNRSLTEETEGYTSVFNKLREKNIID